MKFVIGISRYPDIRLFHHRNIAMVRISNISIFLNTTITLQSHKKRTPNASRQGPSSIK